MQGVLTILIIAAALPGLVALTNKWTEMQSNRWARKRLENDHLFFVGANIKRLELHGHPSPLMTDCTITRLDADYVEMQDNKGLKISFSPIEFEGLHPIFAGPKKVTPKKILPKKAAPRRVAKKARVKRKKVGTPAKSIAR